MVDLETLCITFNGRRERLDVKRKNIRVRQAASQLTPYLGRCFVELNKTGKAAVQSNNSRMHIRVDVLLDGIKQFVKAAFQSDNLLMHNLLGLMLS